MTPKNWTVGYHVRTADGVSLDFTTDLAAARKYADQIGAHVYEVTRSSGRSVRI